VTREVKRKKINDEAVQRAVELASQIEVPASNLAREDAAEAAQQVIEVVAVVQELAASEAEVLAMMGSEEAKEGMLALQKLLRVQKLMKVSLMLYIHILI